MQLSDKQRYEIIVRHEMGHTNIKIAKDMNIDRNTVAKWIQKYDKDKDVKNKTGAGRHKKTNEEEDDEIINEIKKNNRATAKNIKQNLEGKGIKISTKTIINRLNEKDFSYKKPQEKPFLSEDHKKKRLAWAIKYKDSDWSLLVFSDETSVWNGLGGRKRWVNLKENDIERVTKYPMKVHIWGCISKIGIKRIHIFEEIMDSEKYIEILTTNLLDLFYNNPHLLFQDDNDSKHRS
jgi:transposase